MPPRYAYWTILSGGLPTAFRASDQEELMPTFKRILERQPDAVMKWFARGKLWNSPEEAMDARRDPAEPRKPRQGPSSPERRGRDWRPGGKHEDPRQRFKDAKKARNQGRRQQRWERTHADAKRPAGTAARPFESKAESKSSFGPKARRPFDSTGKSQSGPRPRPPGASNYGAGARPSRPFDSTGKRQSGPRPRPPGASNYGAGARPSRPFDSRFKPKSRPESETAPNTGPPFGPKPRRPFESRSESRVGPKADSTVGARPGRDRQPERTSRPPADRRPPDPKFNSTFAPKPGGKSGPAGRGFRTQHPRSGGPAKGRGPGNGKGPGGGRT